MNHQIQTKNFLLRPLQIEDAKSISEHANNKKIWLNVTDGFPHPYSQGNAVEFIYSKKDENPLTTFAIVVDGKAVGVISVTPKKGIYKIVAETGYWLSEKFWGKGIMTQANKEIVKYAFDNFPEIVKIIGLVYSENVGSARVLEKSGFIKEAFLKKACIKDGKVIDLITYAVFRK